MKHAKMRHRRIKSVIASTMALVCAFALSGLPSAFAANVDWSISVPTQQMQTQNADGQKYITSAASKTVDSFADMLGVSAVTWSAGAGSGITWNTASPADNLSGFKKNVFVGVFSTDLNENPNPWGSNLFYNINAEANGGTTIDNYMQYVMMYTSRQDSPGPNAADTNTNTPYGTSKALAMRPDILIGCNGADGAYKGYTAQVAEINSWHEGNAHYVSGDETYSPACVDWTSSTMHAHAGVMYGIADGVEVTIEKSKVNGQATKATRYSESAREIAQKYEKYMLASQYYVLSQINNGSLQKKTVGFVRLVDTDNNKVRFLANGANNAGTNFRGVEALQYTTTNILDKKGYTASEQEKDGDTVKYSYYAGTADDVLDCDVIIIQTDNTDGGAGDGVSADEWAGKLKTVLDASATDKNYKTPDIFVNTPKAALSLGRGAADCAMNYGIYLGYVYPEAINPVHMLAYFYQNFYHIKSNKIEAVLGALASNMSLPTGVTLESVSSYSANAVESKFDAGMQYYARNKTAVDAMAANSASGAYPGDLTPYAQLSVPAVSNPDTTALQTLIGTAEQLNANTLQGASASEIEEGKYFASAADKATFTQAIDKAKAAKTNALVQAEVATATQELQAAVDAFNAARAVGTKKANVDNGDKKADEGTTAGMFRLYNPNSGEHFYTHEVKEHDNLVSLGWIDEGQGWVAPVTSNTPVYRLYNPNAGEHHYTMDASEKDYLVSLGWIYEGIGWYSDDAKGQVLYREYNPNEFANNHNYTTNKTEHDWLLSLGWNDEGTAWYGLAS